MTWRWLGNNPPAVYNINSEKNKMDNKDIEEAIRFISMELKENPEADKTQLIEKASQKYDLNPLQTEFLLNKYVYGK
jgi:hypothetical protein